MAIGGQDLICVRQNYSSTIPSSELKGYLEDLGDVMFSDGKSPLLRRKTRDGKQKVLAPHSNLRDPFFGKHQYCF